MCVLVIRTALPINSCCSVIKQPTPVSSESGIGEKPRRKGCGRVCVDATGGAGTIWYYGTLEEEPISFKMIPTEGTIWFGDSGGAIVDSSGTLVGIISSMKRHRSVLFENSAIRVDRFLPWIAQVISETPQ